MKLFLILVSIIFLSSCCTVNDWRLRGEYGYGEPIHLSTLIVNETNGLPLHLSYLSIKTGPTVYENDFSEIDFMAGPFLAIPDKYVSSAATGIVLTPRIIGNEMGGGARLFFSVDLGLGWFDWEPQGSEFNFVVGGGPGIIMPIADGIWMSLSTSLFHVSNAKIAEPNHGFNSDLVVMGIEIEL